MTATPGESSAERDRRDGGFILIFVLGVLLLLAIVAASIQLKAQLAAKARRALTANAELTAAADGMVRLVAYRLGEQRAGARLLPPIAVDGRPAGCSRDDVTFVIRVQDQGGLVDLNSAPLATLQRLFESVAASNARALAAAVIDFRDTDDTETEAGAERPAYTRAGLKHGPKNAPFEAIEELDQVLGMTPELLSRLLPLVTVHAPPGSLDPAVAPRAVRTAFALPEPAAVPTGAQIRPGERGRARLFGIEVMARRGAQVSGRRAVIGFVEGAPTGFVVRSWTAVAPGPEPTVDIQTLDTAACT